VAVIRLQVDTAILVGLKILPGLIEAEGVAWRAPTAFPIDTGDAIRTLLVIVTLAGLGLGLSPLHPGAEGTTQESGAHHAQGLPA
jgi:hypothetical protein